MNITSIEGPETQQSSNLIASEDCTTDAAGQVASLEATYRNAPRMSVRIWPMSASVKRQSGLGFHP